uniref:F-box/LRR-repeat protein n=1 Tax=Ascaris lumbricoides TaxID=6252 RepID=A0A0M3I317_ASCLU
MVARHVVSIVGWLLVQNFPGNDRCCLSRPSSDNSGSTFQFERTSIFGQGKCACKFELMNVLEILLVSNDVRRLSIDFGNGVSQTVLAESFPERMINVTHLDIGIFLELSDVVATKIVNCFPNLEVLNMGRTGEAQVMSMFSEDAFPRIRRLILGHLENFCDARGNFVKDFVERLWVWRRPLTSILLRGFQITNFEGLKNAPFKLALSELHLEAHIGPGVFDAVSNLVNLTIFTLNPIVDDEDRLAQRFGPLELEAKWSYLVPSILCTPENSTTSYCLGCCPQLQSLGIAGSRSLREEDIHKLIKRLHCPQLQSLGIAGSRSLREEDIHKLIKRLQNLRFLDLSDINVATWNEVMLNENDLPNLRFLMLHFVSIDMEALEKFNLKRPEVIISAHPDHFINWNMLDGKVVFNSHFDGDINAVLNDLDNEPGFCCMSRFLCRNENDFDCDDVDDF